jgi:hypothetical protein
LSRAPSSGAASSAAALACACLGAGCVTFEYQRDLIERVPDDAVFAAFVPGQTVLSDVLAGMGAPLDVWEGPEGAPVLAYGGLRSAEWNVNLSVPVTDYNSASFSYTDTTARTRGYMLLFGPDQRLEIVRYGLLADLRRTYARRRPASVDEETP